MDVEKVFPLLFIVTAGSEELKSLDVPEVATVIDETLIPDYPFGNKAKLDLNYSNIYLPKECLEALQQLFESFGIEVLNIQLNLKYCLVSMLNAKYLGFTSTRDIVNEEAVFFSKGGHVSSKLQSLTFSPPKGKNIVISSKNILSQIQQILAKYKWDDEQLTEDLEAADHESRLIKVTKSNSLVDAISKRYFFSIYTFLDGKISQEDNKKGIAQFMLYIVDFKNTNPILFKDSAIDAGKKTFNRNKGGQLKF